MFKYRKKEEDWFVREIYFTRAINICQKDLKGPMNDKRGRGIKNEIILISSGCLTHQMFALKTDPVSLCVITTDFHRHR